jgi:predicted O-methyltransferase YrrM
MKTKNSYLKINGWFSRSDHKVYELAVENFADNSIFVEVGCFMGRSTVAMAELIETSNKNIIFYAIDHFEGSSEHKNRPEIKNKKLFEIFSKNTSRVKKFIKVIKSDSLKASSKFENNSIDFIYIDASHEYEFISQDINFWYPKLKATGWLTGHDYKWQGVKKAITEFCQKEKNHVENLIIYENSWCIKFKKSFKKILLI